MKKLPTYFIVHFTKRFTNFWLYLCIVFNIISVCINTAYSNHCALNHKKAEDILNKT